MITKKEKKAPIISYKGGGTIHKFGVKTIGEQPKVEITILMPLDAYGEQTLTLSKLYRKGAINLKLEAVQPEFPFPEKGKPTKEKAAKTPKEQKSSDQPKEKENVPPGRP